MPKLVIQVQRIDKPTVDAAGRKFGAKVYDTAGTKYTVPKALLGMFQEGGSYEVYVEDKTYQGNPYKSIETAVSVAGPPPRSLERARTAQADEAQINNRHRITWIGERLNIFAGQMSLDEAALSSEAMKWGRIYDRLSVGAEEEPQQKINGPAKSTGSGQQLNEEMGDEIPF